jgi:hypothetical protein
MTLRERIADWLTGGAYAEFKRKRAEWAFSSVMNRTEADRLRDRLTDIANGTAGIESGTAKKVHRMAVEAINSTP